MGLFKNRTARQAIAGRSHLVGSEVEQWRRWAEDENCPDVLCERIADVLAALRELDKACAQQEVGSEREGERK